MLLFRMGPRYLFIRTDNIDETTKFLKKTLGVKLLTLTRDLRRHPRTAPSAL